MILRSLKLVHFRGVPDVQVPSLPEAGVARVPLPAGARSEVVQEAVRYALAGETGETPVISEGAGYACVEAAFRAPGGAVVSVFRGVARQGTPQVSLREDSGMRITSGADDVARRLEEILGLPAAAVADALCPPPAGAPWPVPPAPAGTAAVRAADPAAVEAARARAGDAIDGLRRALRIRTLAAASRADHDALLALGGRLRRERTDTALLLERVVASRERLRVRLRRVNEYRDLALKARADAASAAPPQAPRRGPPRAIEWCVGLTALGLLALLLTPLVAPGTAPSVRDDPVGRVITGFGFVIAVSSYLFLASKRHGAGRFVATASPEDTERDAPPPAPRSAAEALRARYADLGDPDDPVLVEDLRARLAHCDDEAAPLQRRLERIDDAIALLDVEAGRAARVLHLPIPDRDEAAAGLADGEIDRASDDIANLGDAIHQASVEHDALVAQGTPPVAEAARELVEAFRSLSAAALGDAAPGEEAAVAERATPESVATIPEDADTDALAARLGSAADGFAVAAAAPVPATEAPTAVVGPLAAAVEPVSLLTAGRFRSLRAQPDGSLVLESPTESLPLAEFDPSVRARLELAVRLRMGDEPLREAFRGEPRCAVLSGPPAGFASDDEVPAFAAGHAAGVTQVVWGVPGAAEPPPSVRRGDRRRR